MLFSIVLKKLRQVLIRFRCHFCFLFFLLRRRRSMYIWQLWKYFPTLLQILWCIYSSCSLCTTIWERLLMMSDFMGNEGSEMTPKNCTLEGKDWTLLFFQRVILKRHSWPRNWFILKIFAIELTPKKKIDTNFSGHTRTWWHPFL